VAIVPWDANSALLMNIQRAVQLTKVLQFLDPDNTHGYVEGGAWLVPQFLADSQRWRGVVWNASPDEVEEIIVHPPWEMGELLSAVQVTARGDRYEARLDGNRVRLGRPLHQWEFVVLS